MLGVFFVVNLLFYSTYGLIPRYMIPATAVAVIFAARGAFQLKPAHRKAVIGITIAVVLLSTTMFLYKIYQNEHIQSMQHDYEGAAVFMLERAEGDFTVITSRQYQMAFYLLKNDEQQQAFVELVPEQRELLIQMLQGNFSKPDLLKDSSVPYDTSLPPVRFVVVHERLETGPQPGLADYNITEFMDAYPGAERFEIGSRFPNSRTWIYELR